MTISGIASAPSPVVPPPILSSLSAGTAQGVTAGGSASSSDSVSVSGLAKALRGDSLTAFGALSDKQKAQLASLVDSGKITGEEVSDALKQRLKQARSSALGATERMFNNDHADLLHSGDTNSDDLRDALSETLAKRSDLMNKLTAATDAGVLSSTSDTLQAREINPRLLTASSGESNTAMPSFFFMDFEDSRINYTKREGDAAYKLKSLGVDFRDIDASLRGIGEKDASAILSERAGLTSSRKVAGDPDFSMNDAVRKPLIAGNTSSLDTSFSHQEEMMLARFANAKKVPAGNGVYKILFSPDSPSSPQIMPDKVTSQATGGLSVSVEFTKGLLPRY